MPEEVVAPHRARCEEHACGTCHEYWTFRFLRGATYEDRERLAGRRAAGGMVEPVCILGTGVAESCGLWFYTLEPNLFIGPFRTQRTALRHRERARKHGLGCC